MTDNFGTSVSRTLDPTATEYSEVVFIEGAPICDAELNLIGQLAEDWQRKLVLRGTPSGWIGNGVNQSKVYVTDPTFSNYFLFGPQRAGDQQSIMWAVVNGWLIPVTGSNTGLPPGSADNTDTYNKILLSAPPVSAGSARSDFIFLEVWKALVSPSPSTLNKPNSSAVYRFGNVLGGFSYLPDDLIDPEIGEPTTDRVQVQYRIRVVSGLNNLSTSPDGFDSSCVFAQGGQSTVPVGGFTFSNMREVLGDVGLYRSGDGNPGNSLGTVDGYCYAIPIAICFRRCSTLWSGDPSPNLNGALSRGSVVATFSTVPTLAVAMAAGDSTITLVSIANIPLPASPASAVAIQIGGEILTYASINSTTISVVRGVNGTVAEAHPAGTVVKVLSSRPDGLFADQITGTDLLDLRHVISPSGFDYQSLLQSNLDKLLRGQLRTSYKRSGTDPRGPYLHFEDKISQTPPAILGITALDAPDHIRLAFSDAAIQQPVEFIVTPIASGPTFPLLPPTPPHPTPTAPVIWDLQLPNPVMAISQNAASVWSVGDTIQLDVVQLKSSLPGSDADQVRFLNEVPVSSTLGYSYGTKQLTDTSLTSDFTDSIVYPGDILVIFTPLTGAPFGGTYPITEVTSTVLTSSVTIPAPVTPGPVSYEIRRGIGSIQIRIDGYATFLPQHSFEVTPANPTPTDDLVIQFLGDGSSFPTSSSGSQVYITTNVQYGGGRGLARRPDSVHNVVLVSPGSSDPEILVQPSYNSPGEFTISTSWVPLWSKFRNTLYKGNLPVTIGSYIDSGSKSIILQPFQKISFLQQVRYLTASGGSIMPSESGYGSGSDPLALFSQSNYVTLPRHLIPGFGAVIVPILPANSTDFDQGVNFMLLSRSSTHDNSTYINYTAAYSIFSTLVAYNTASGSPLRAGIRFFNDDPTVGGALSTARGLGRQGLELPPYYGIARLIAIYEAGDFAAHGSGAANLLRQSFDGPVFWIERDDLNGGVSTFIINSEIIDLTKSIVNPISSFAAGNYVIEANIFGFGIGSFDLTKSFRLALSSTLGATPTQPVPGPVTVLPGPLPATATALINYSRTPYQADIFGTQSNFNDIGYQRGPLDSPTAYEISSTSLTANALTRPNQKSLEILASIGFITSLGTGRLSGDFVQPNVYDPRNVGYEDPLLQSPSDPHHYPPLDPSNPRPLIKLGAIGSSPSFTDLEANPEYLGLTTRLPLGALYRDKDFHGGRFSNEQSSPLIYIDKVGVGSGVAGLAVTETLDQTESPTMPAEVSAGLPGDVVVLVDGESINYSSLVNFRTNRGGSAFIGSGDRPGGEIFATYERILGSVSGSRTLVGRAFLVRNAPTHVGSTQVSAGDELMMAVVTQVMELGTTPSEAMVLLGTNGSGEGLSAADLYRIEGHPIIANHTFYDVDPSTIQLPVGKTIAQITAPPDTPVIPLGAANTVYASNGSNNFWTNSPTVQGLDVLGTASISGNAVFTSNAITFNNLTHLTTPSLSSGTTNGIVLSTGNATGTANAGSVTVVPGSASGTGNGGALLLDGGVASGTTGNGGLVILAGGVASSGTGNGGNVTIRGGDSLISGNGGNLSLLAGSGSSNGLVSVGVNSVNTYAKFTNLDLILGPATGTGNYGIQFTAGTTNPTIGQTTGTGSGSLFTIQAQNAGSGNNNGGGVRLISGYGTGTGTTGDITLVNSTYTNVRVTINDTEDVAFFGSYLTELGDPVINHDYSLIFSSRVTNAKIGQKPTNQTENLIIKAADINSLWTGAGGDLQLEGGNGLGSSNNGGNVVLIPGAPGAGGSQGLVLFKGPSVVFNLDITDPSITQLDQTGSHAAANMFLSAQDQTHSSGGWGAGSLNLGSGSSTSGSAGDINLTGGYTGSSTPGTAGGSIRIATGQSTNGTFGSVYIQPGGYDKARFDINGLRLLNQRGTDDNAIAFAKSGNDPPAIPSGTTAALYTTSGSVNNVLKYSTGSNDIRVIEGTVLRYSDNSDTSTSNPISSASVTILTLPAIAVIAGDLIEGAAHLSVSADPTEFTTTSGFVTVRLSDGVAPVDFTVTWILGQGVNQMISIPVYYTPVASTTLTISLIAGVSGGYSSALVILNALPSPLPWIILKQVRGYPF